MSNDKKHPNGDVKMTPFAVPPEHVELTEAELQQVAAMRQQALDQVAAGIAEQLLTFLPNLAPEKAIWAARTSVMSHQEGAFNAVLEHASPGHPFFTERELWSVGVVPAGGGRKPLAEVAPRKDLNEVRKNPQELVGWLMVFSAATNPTVRALLLALDYDLHFTQRPLRRVVG